MKQNISTVTRVIMLLWFSFLFLSYRLLGNEKAEQEKMDIMTQVELFRTERELPVSPEKRLALISELKAITTEEYRNNGQSPSTVKLMLIWLGDQITIDQAVNDLSSEDRFPLQAAIWMLQTSPNPQVFIALSKALFREEGIDAKVIDKGDYSIRVIRPPSIQAMRIIRRLIDDLDDIPQETKAWFEKTTPDYGMDGTRELIREWWKINEEALTAGNWKEVKPGPPLPPRKVPGG
jgi:hypothetical protein